MVPAAPPPIVESQAPVAAEPAAPAIVPPAPRPVVPAPPAVTAAVAVPTAAAPSPLRVRRGLLFVPLLGLHSYQDSNETGLDAGLRVGALFGAFANDAWSLNVGATFDVLNPNSAATDLGLNLTEEVLSLTFNPLFHLGTAKTEFVIGPKVGGWVAWDHLSATSSGGPTTTVDGTGEGWSIGANMGLFLAASPGVLAGVMSSLEVQEAVHRCDTVSGMAERCTSNSSSATVLSFAFALMLTRAP